MNEKMIKNNLLQLFERWAEVPAQTFEKMPAHGSDRQYFRMKAANISAIGVHNPDLKENIAFLTFSKHFHNHGLHVPEIYEQELDKEIYLEEDLGDETLFSFLTHKREKEGFSDSIVNIYEQVIDELPKFQVTAGKDLDYSVCYPRHSFDRQSMGWDLNYFKYYFLKLAKIPFNEQKLEDDYNTFMNFLLEAPKEFFLYRDFQSRNIMIKDDQPYFIDYQGGRKGPLQYDLASLLFDAKADIPDNIREDLLNRYINKLQEYTSFEKTQFLNYYHGYVFIRIMQALGAYGFRGFYERKEHFLKSVPYAIKNLEGLLHTANLPIEIPELTDAWSRLIRSTVLREFADKPLRLTVRIQSFSYKRGIPWDEKGHGGGFVFDCRSLPNPGRLDSFKNQTGNDAEVIQYLGGKAEVGEFLQHIKSMTTSVINNYQNRKFTDLIIAFGCTGGQHRSVYCANQLAAFLKSDFDIDVDLRHRELELKL